MYLFLSNITAENLSLFERVGMTLSMGINCGVIGINVAHELGHRNSKIEIFLAKALLVSSLYYQFFIDHNKGHHKFVSTPKDPASAAKNTNLYQFIVSSVVGTFISAFRIDKVDMIIGLAIQAIAMLGIYYFMGNSQLAFFTLAACIGFILLECVNYIEHYGLQRKINPSGRYEKVQPKHSWNSNHIIGRGVLFNLSRHSDHHYMANKKYQKLQSMQDAPQMPTGYPGMILLSLIPSLWFRVMNPRIPTDED